MPRKKKNVKKSRPTMTLPVMSNKTGLKIDKVPDLSIRIIDDRPANSILDGKSAESTPEQDVMKAASKTASELLEDSDVTAAINSMITFRRGYAIVYRAFQEMMERKKAEFEKLNESFSETAEDFLIQFAMYEATKAFNEHQFMQGMLTVVMPFMADVIDKHSREEHDAKVAEHNAQEEIRVKQPIPIGFKHTPQQETSDLLRDRTLVLVGKASALSWIVDKVIHNLNNTSDKPHQIIRFMQHAPNYKVQQRCLVRVPSKAWQGSANTPKALAMCMGEFVADKLSSPPDLLVVDDLAHAYTKGFVGRLGAANAGDAHKQIRKWCNNAGCGLIGLVPTDDPGMADITGAEWEQLRIFTTLRTVTVEDAVADDKYRIIVGSYADVFDVDKIVIDSYERGNVVLPSWFN